MQTAMQLYAKHKAGPLAAVEWSSHTFVPVLNFPPESDRQMELQKIFEQYPPETGDEFQFHFVRSVLEDRESPPVPFCRSLHNATFMPIFNKRFATRELYHCCYDTSSSRF
jgi:hypothetical protein